MLQQTQVSTVIPYYLRWIHRFPDLQTLAGAPLEEALKYWEGLGYYSRCRHLHSAVRWIVKHNNGIIPNDYKRLHSLPGIGEYTAKAILSLGFGQPVPVIDGNVKRVLSRYLAIRKLTPRNSRRVEKFLQGMISHSSPGQFNQAVMDLGRDVCFPRKPDCGTCPLQGECKAFLSGKPETYPLKTKTMGQTHRRMVAVLFQHGDRYLVVRRSNQELLGGLWGIPSRFATEKAVDPLINAWFNQSEYSWEHLGAVKHTYSHFRTTANLYHCQVEKPDSIDLQSPKRWITLRERTLLPFSKIDHKLFSLFLNQDKPNV